MSVRECATCIFVNSDENEYPCVLCKDYSKHDLSDLYIKDVSALNKQVGGGHYTQFKIQPIEFIVENKLGYSEGNVVKYVSRHKFKNGAEDIRKAIHYCELILKMEYGE